MGRATKRKTVKGSLTLVVPLHLNDDFPKKATNEFFSELEAHLSHIFLSLPWGHVARLEAKRLSSAKSYAPYLAAKNRPRGSKLGRNRLLKVTAEVSAPSEASCAWGEDKFIVGQEPRSALAAASEALIDRVSLVAVASQLAAPGYAHFYESRPFINDEAWGVGPIISWVLFEALYSAKEHGWPTISRLTIAEADAWLAQLPGMLEGMGKGRTGRAVAALTHILCSSPNESSEMGIAWALLGLEALYAEGNQGLSQQILRKSEVDLGGVPQLPWLTIILRVWCNRLMTHANSSTFRPNKPSIIFDGDDRCRSLSPS
jgi:hypothetical protein